VLLLLTPKHVIPLTVVVVVTSVMNVIAVNTVSARRRFLRKKSWD